MKRYHIDINFPSEHTEKLKSFVKKINSQSFKYSKHCIDRLYQNLLSSEKVSKSLSFLKNLSFEYEHIFEYYIEGGEIVKACFRLSYSSYNDIIIVLSQDKVIITVYLNDVKDEHITLNRELYVKK